MKLSMPEKIPRKLLHSRYRKEMWIHAKKILKILKKDLPIAEAYLAGSFATKKRRPADVDMFIYLKLKGKHRKDKWAADFEIVPENKFGQRALEDLRKWMKQKYGAKNSAVIRLR